MKPALIKTTLFSIIAVLTIVSCSKTPRPTNRAETKLNSVAVKYVFLALSLGKYDADYIDAYFGPDSIKKAAERRKLTIQEIAAKSDSLEKALRKIKIPKTDSLLSLRKEFLASQLKSLNFRARQLEGEKASFDEESKALYGVVAKKTPYSYYDSLYASLGEKLPGKGKISKRFIEYRRQFLIPKDKLDSVYKLIVNESRARTKRKIKLPENENFELRFVNDKPWGGYNWFKGNAHSLIQINLDFPTYIDRPIGLICHEGYPGHHVYHSLLEENFVKKRKWTEYSVYPLFSPEALLSEGLANFGVSVVFPPKDKLNYEKKVLCPLVGVSPSEYAKYAEISDIVEKLSRSSVDIARDYLDGKIDRKQAAEKIAKYRLRPIEEALKNVDFFDKYRSYIVNYYVGQDLCARWVESRGGTTDNPEARWRLYARLLSVPATPAFLLRN